MDKLKYVAIGLALLLLVLVGCEREISSGTSKR